METELPPAYSEATAIKAAFQHLNHAERSFPKKFTISQNSTDSAVKWILREYRHLPLYAISRRENPSGNKPDVILHDGVSLRDPTVASFRCLQGTPPRTWKVRLPPSHSSTGAAAATQLDGPGLELVSAGSDWRAQKRPVLRFSVATSVCDGQREDFEWRSSNNDNIRVALGGGQSLGWKLVRLTQDAFSAQLPGPRGAWPRTKEGAEIVAVFSSSGLGSAEWRFAFLGTGSHGVLGSTWEVMAVTTALILMDTSIRMTSESG